MVVTNVAMSTLVSTMVKFTYICILKSIPNVDDSFLTTFALISINMISLISVSSILNLPGKQLPYNVNVSAN